MMLAMAEEDEPMVESLMKATDTDDVSYTDYVLLKQSPIF